MQRIASWDSQILPDERSTYLSVYLEILRTPQKSNEVEIGELSTNELNLNRFWKTLDLALNNHLALQT